MSKKCRHALLILTIGGGNILAHCANCREKVLSNTELRIWKYGLGGSHRDCEGKIVSITKSGSAIRADCLTCGETIANGYELKIQKQSILTPKVDLERVTWRVR